MCGVAGLLVQEYTAPDVLARTVKDMAETLLHRGPDDSGVWVNAEVGIALGHQRLAVVDLSSAGHQPIISDSGHHIMVFNGEIYNHQALRQEIDINRIAYGNTSSENQWRGHSDSETLLAGIELWGLEATLNKVVGIFSIAIWNTTSSTLTLARDRFGEKPLYYGWAAHEDPAAAVRTFLFGSELKALRKYPGFANRVCREALAQYMRHLYVPAPLSIYEDIYKLEPGCMLTVQLQPGSIGSMGVQKDDVLIHRWWALADVVSAGLHDQFDDEAEAIDVLDQHLTDAVNLQSLADVSLGAFLSGGVDSSVIVALMQKNASRPTKTFTVGFEENGFDESPFARKVAQHLGTEHTELIVTSNEARDVVPLLPGIYDEPFADSSQIPTYLLCKLAREKVTVALSGDGGDELFGGYNRYFWSTRIWSRIAWMPYFVRRAVGNGIGGIPITAWDALSRPVNAMLRGSKGLAAAGQKAHKLAGILSNVQGIDDLYLGLVSQWQDPALVIRGITQSPHQIYNCETVVGLDAIQRMMYLDSLTYLPGDILCKVDRAAMAASLETRMPFLDHRVAELAWKLPLHMKIRGNIGKWALRQVLNKYVPQKLIDRPKMGFGIPIDQWLRGPLRSWAECLLNEDRLEEEGYFYPAPIRRQWAEHLSGRQNHAASLWAVLMFQSWLAHSEGNE